jgi:transposase-like protein
MNCPACASSNLRCHGKRNALYPSGLPFVIGLVLASLHQASSPIDYHCQACGLDFARRTRLARVAIIELILALIWTVLALSLPVALFMASRR